MPGSRTLPKIVLRAGGRSGWIPVGGNAQEHPQRRSIDFWHLHNMHYAKCCPWGFAQPVRTCRPFPTSARGLSRFDVSPGGYMVPGSFPGDFHVRRTQTAVLEARN